MQGIFMDNGSGGFMTDLTFNGGKFGAFFGNQQFTTRNLTFNNCQTAVFMNWNWVSGELFLIMPS
jgi:glucan 1,3-beta-glucosidase